MSTTGLQLILDMRETALADACRTLGLAFSTSSLDVGDFMIQSSDGTPLLVAERKTLADFAASNADGRYREQRVRLMAVRGSGVAVLYILEGAWSGDDDRRFGGGRTTEGQLKRLLTRLVLRYGMPVLQSTSVYDTAAWCGKLLSQLINDITVFHPESGGIAETTTAAMSTYTATFTATKKANRGDGVAIGMLSAIPGLGAKKVSALLAERTIADLCGLSAEEIAALVVGGKKLGVVGSAIYDALHWKA